MLYFLSGIVLTGAGAGGFAYLRPRNGQIQRIVMMPVLEWLIPVTLTTAIAFGVSLVVGGLMS